MNLTFVDNPRVQFDSDRGANDFGQESRWIASFSVRSILHPCWSGPNATLIIVKFKGDLIESSK